MVSWSKLHPGISEADCSCIAHSWTKSCVLGTADMFFASCIGSTGFFALVYFIQFLQKVVKKKNKTPLNDVLRMYLRSTIFASLNAAGTIASSCLLRKILGRYHYYTMVMIPAAIGGCAIFLENRKSRELFTNAFSNCVLEFWINLLEKSKILKWNSNHKTIIFMILSSLLSYLLSATNYHQHYYWFFMPPREVKKYSNSTNGKTCFHDEDCFILNFNIFFKYSVTGYIIQVIKSFFYNIKEPKLFLLSLVTPKTFKLAAFLGGYVAVYQAARCFLFQKYKKYSLAHDTIAGFLAGATFRFQPTINIFNSVIINILQILTEMSCKQKLLPDIPYLELIFIFSCGILFHSRVLYSDMAPKLLAYIMNTITHHRIEWAADNYLELLNNISNK